MDVHGTKLARTLLTIATGVERGAAEQGVAKRAAALILNSMSHAPAA